LQYEGATPSYMTRMVGLVFLSPDAVDAILARIQRAEVSARMLTLDTTIPYCWKQQRALVLPSA